MLLLLVACGDGGTTPTSPPTPPTPVATSITLSTTSLSFSSLGATQQLTATVKDQNGATMSGAAVNWSSSSASVATVSSTGLVTASGGGTATVTATSSSAVATVTVSVVQVAASIELSDTLVSFLALGDTTQLTATVKDVGGAAIGDASVTWSSSDTAVATISDAGLVTSVADGTAVITAISGAQTAAAAVTVTQVAASIELSPTSLVLVSIGDTATLSATVKDAAGSVVVGATVSWSSTAQGVATVSDAGLVTAIGNGTATIATVSGSANGTASVAVTQVASTVELSPSSLEFVSIGATATLSATVKDAAGVTIDDAPVTWSSSNTAVVTVSSAGLVTSVAVGTATITATSGSLSATASVAVTQVASTVELSPSSLEFVSIGATATLSATVKDAAGVTISDAPVTWSSSNTAVVTVSSAGLVTSVAVGTATITATSGSLSATASVTVTELVATTITLSPTSLSFTSLGATSTLIATVKDQNGATMSGATVTWATSAASVATVSSAGLVTSVGNGTATITATSGTLTATATVTVDLGDVVVSITSVDPTIWTEGAAATITGSGFSATASSNTVTVDGLTASITSASTTELQITVPTAACKPSRVVDLVVTVASASATATVGVKPASVWSLNVGGGVYTIGGDCLHLEAGSGSEEYMIGFLNTSESPSSLTPIKQTAIAGTVLAAGAAHDIPIVSDEASYFEAPIIAFGDRPAAGPAPQQFRIDPEYEAEMLAHTEAEARRREVRHRTEESLGRIGRDAQGMSTVMREATARSVGDTIPIRVWVSGNLCRDTTWAGYDGITEDISAVVRYIGSSAIYLEDTGNPLSESFTAAEYATWDATLSGTTMPTIKNYFGEFWTGTAKYGAAGDDLGLDADGRVGVVITKAVNKDGNTLGFVNPYDLYAKSYCNISNQAELFYGHAPDPDGIYALGAKTTAEVAAKIPTLIAHEVTHILQGTQDTYFGAAYKSVWETEGGANLAEQLVGMAVLGHGSGQNLGKTKWLQGYSGDRWYRSWAHDLRNYFGLESINSPEECTWLARDADNDGPCWNGRAVYGVPATLLRLILDWYGPSYAGGEAALMRDLFSSAQIGYANLEARTGKSIGYLLTIFGITLWADGRGYNNYLTSWDLYPIMEAWSGTDYKLQPHASSDAEPTGDLSVRGGSTGYLRWAPPNGHAPTSLRITTPDGGELPDAIGFWIMRIQ